MQLVVVVSSFNLALTFNGHIFSLLSVYFSIITLNKGNVGTKHLNNRILLFVCNRKVIYYYYITLPDRRQLHITTTYYYYPSPAYQGSKLAQFFRSKMATRIFSMVARESFYGPVWQVAMSDKLLRA